MISRKTKYALKALVTLAAEYKTRQPVLISELAERDRTPKKFLEQILLELKNKGFLASKKGKGGGYLLAKSPEKISIGSVVRLFEGSVALLPCVSQTAYERCAECIDENACGIRSVMKEVRDETARILDGTSLREVLERSYPPEGMYHI
ncbi:MAG: Rrf2 family transcriptional regulator [Candidatus Omnitrophica bacterium]|nr:Rrf2 family transcriptional regulator [Candidatus Omnitrophota bacterium]